MKSSDLLKLKNNETQTKIVKRTFVEINDESITS